MIAISSIVYFGSDPYCNLEYLHKKRGKMKNNRREEIIMATLRLVGEHGLGNVSMSMIANEIGIKKPSLYNHFSSKEELVETMYQYLREHAKKKSDLSSADYGSLFAGKSALEILRQVVDGYIKMNSDEYMQSFYKAIYSGRCVEPASAGILVEETEKMIFASRQLFYAMEVHKLLHFNNPDISAISFALTIHGLMDYRQDLSKSGMEGKFGDVISGYLDWFCKENAVGKSS